LDCAAALPAKRISQFIIYDLFGFVVQIGNTVNRPYQQLGRFGVSSFHGIFKETIGVNLEYRYILFGVNP
jgi:hypothetical protein